MILILPIVGNTIKKQDKNNLHRRLKRSPGSCPFIHLNIGKNADGGITARVSCRAALQSKGDFVTPDPLARNPRRKVQSAAFGC